MSINVTRVTKTIKVEHIDRTFNIVVRPKTFNIHAGGRRGFKGDDGIAGVNGTDGINGANGADGADGIQGIQGIQGTPGADGNDAPSDHLLLTNIGVNTHDQIDGHIADNSNPHSVTKAQVGLSNVPNTDFTSAVNANTAKVGITPTQASNITTNNAKVSYTDASDVSANTSARHSHANKGLLDTYTQTNANIANAVSKAHDPVDISGKQDTLVSATNIKTINSTSILGSGDIVISGGGGAVDSVNAKTGVVVLNADDIAETATKKYLTNGAQTIEGLKTFGGFENRVNPFEYALYLVTKSLNEETWALWTIDDSFGADSTGSMYWDSMSGSYSIGGALTFHPEGRIGLRTAYFPPTATLDMINTDPIIGGVKFKSAVGQTADLLNFRDSSNVVKFKVDKDGNITGANLSGTNTGDQVGDGTTITGAGTALDPFVANNAGFYDGGNSSTIYGGTITINGGNA